MSIDKEENQNKNIDRLLKVFESDLEYKNKELEAKNNQIQTEKEVRIETLKFNDKDSERGFEAFKMANDRENNKFKFARNIGYFLLLLIFMIFIFSGYLILENRKEGVQILTALITIGLSFLAGLGFKRIFNSADSSKEFEN